VLLILIPISAKKSIADTNIEIEKYRHYRYSTNRYFGVDVNVTGDIRRRICGIKHRNRVQQPVTCLYAGYAPYVTISHEYKSAGSIVLIPDLGLNQLKEHVELELTRTFGTFEVN
jgi:hypothetical protein